MLGLNAGSAHVTVRPDLRGFNTAIATELKQLQKTIASNVSAGIRDGLGDGFKGTPLSEPAKRKGRESGADFAGAFDREVRTRVAAAAKSMPKIQIGAAATEAEQKIRDLQLDLAKLNGKRIGVDIDAAGALAEVSRIEGALSLLGSRSPDIQVRTDTARAVLELRAVAAMAERVDGKDVDINVKTHGGSEAVGVLERSSLSLGQMALAAGSLGTALIPVTAAAVGLGAALSAPLAAAGGGLTVFGIIAGLAVKKTKDQIKEIQDLGKKAEDARAAINDASTKATRATAVQEAADATAAYKNALNQLSPAQTRFMTAQTRLKDSFGDLVRTAGPVIFGPLIKGMNLLSRLMPTLQPILRAVSGALGSLIGEVSRMAQGPGFKSFIDFFAKSAGKAMMSFAHIMMNVGLGIAGLIKAFAPLGTQVLGTIERLSYQMLNLGSSKGTRAFIDYVKQWLPTVVGFFGDLFRVAVHLVKALAPIGGVVLKGLSAVFRVITKIPVQDLTIGIAALVAGFVALNVVMAITAANPVTLIIIAVVAAIAGLVIGLRHAYESSRTFRKIVNVTWAQVQKDFRILWAVVKPILHGIAHVVTDIVAPAISWFWGHVVKPTFRAIGAAIKFVWDHVIRPVFNAISDVLTKEVFPVLRHLWTDVVKPTFRLIGALIKVWWAGVKIVFFLLKTYLTKVIFPVFRLLWDVVKPVFKSIGDWIAKVWHNNIKPVFSAIGDFIHKHMVPSFQSGVNAIARAWGGIKKAAAAPVNFVIDTVYNHGLRSFVNGVLDKFPGDAPKLPWVRPLGAKMSGGQERRLGGTLNQFADGGVMPGYTPGRDVHRFSSPTGGSLALSGGEAFMVPEWTKMVGGPKVVKRMNAAARKGRQQFGKGGVFWPVPGHDTSTYPGHDGVDINRGSGWDDFGDAIRAFRDGVISYVGAGRGYGNAIFERGTYGEVVYGHTSGQRVRAGQHVRGGQVIGSVGNSGNASAPHLHFGYPGGTTAQALALLSGAITSGIGPGGGGSLLGGLVDAALSKMTDAVFAPINHIPGADTAFGSIAVGASRRAADSVKDWIVSKFGGSSSGVTGDATPVNANARLGRKMSASRGWGRFWPDLNALVMSESGWNNTAQNPDSSAYGIGQFLDSTWATVGARKTSDAAAQIRAMLDYIAQRYVNPARAWTFKQANNSYDNGGILPKGLSLAMNGTGRNEHKAVFTDAQWRTLKAAITGLTRNGGKAITGTWLTGLLDKLPKGAEQLRHEFLRTRDAMREVRTRTERARRTRDRIRESDRYQDRAQEARRTRRAFRAARSGEAIGTDISDTRTDIGRALRRARGSNIGRDALRDYHQAVRQLEKQRTEDVVTESIKRAKWRRSEAKDTLRNANAPVIAQRKVLKQAQADAEKAKGKEDKRAARAAVRAAHQALHQARQVPDSETQRRAKADLQAADRRLKALHKENAEIQRLTRQRDHAGSQSAAVKDLVRARKRLEALRDERKERKQLRRDARQAGRADILKREERAQERLNRRIAAQKKARDKATAAAKAFRAAQQAAADRATGIRDAGLGLGSIGSASFKTSGGILSNLTKAVATVKAWGGVVRSLIGAGLRGPILDEFIDAGPSADAVRTGKSLLAGGQIAKINALQDQLRSASVRAGAIGARTYTPAQRAAIRRASPLTHQAATATSQAGGVTVQYLGMPADTVDTIIHKTATRVMYELDKERV